MTCQEERNCMTAVLIAVRAEQTLLGWAERLSGAQRQEVTARFIAQSNQRAIDLWGAACEAADLKSS